MLNTNKCMEYVSPVIFLNNEQTMTFVLIFFIIRQYKCSKKLVSCYNFTNLTNLGLSKDVNKKILSLKIIIQCFIPKNV